jgi:hypothetical protein
MTQLYKYTDILKQLKDILGDFYITGSLSLSLNGDITRDVSDLDLIVTNLEDLNRLQAAFELKCFCSYVAKTAEEMEMEEDKLKYEESPVNVEGGFSPLKFLKTLRCRISEKPVLDMVQFYVGKTKVDVFIRDNEYDYTIVKDESTGNEYKVAYSKYSFTAKQEIVKKLQAIGLKNLNEKQAKTLAKHLLDLQNNM